MKPVMAIDILFEINRLFITHCRRRWLAMFMMPRGQRRYH
jgi:hypothetical protein